MSLRIVASTKEIKKNHNKKNLLKGSPRKFLLDNLLKIFCQSCLNVRRQPQTLLFPEEPEDEYPTWGLAVINHCYIIDTSNINLFRINSLMPGKKRPYILKKTAAFRCRYV